MTTEQQEAMERLRVSLLPGNEDYFVLKDDLRTLLSAVPTWVEKPTVPGMYFVLSASGTWNLLTLFPGDESEVSVPVYGPVPGCESVKEGR